MTPGEGPAPGQGQGPLGRLAQSAWQAVLLMGVASVILGLLVLIWPGASLRVAGVMFGVYLLVSGIFQLVAAFGTNATAGMRVIGFISGALSVLLGLFCFRDAMESTLLLALWIGIGWLFRGITQTVAAASDPAMPARGWQIFLGVITGLAGVVLIVSPFETLAVLTLVTGIWLLVVGVVEIGSSFAVRKRAKDIPAGV
nr:MULTISPECIES: HdeD family acid-resistance protein [unclassified Streptomyces]